MLCNLVAVGEEGLRLLEFVHVEKELAFGVDQLELLLEGQVGFLGLLVGLGDDFLCCLELQFWN